MTLHEELLVASEKQGVLLTPLHEFAIESWLEDMPYILSPLLDPNTARLIYRQLLDDRRVASL